MQLLTRSLGAIVLSTLLVSLSSCSLVTVPVKVAGKVATTSLGVAGKAAGAGFNALGGGGSKEDEEDFYPED